MSFSPYSRQIGDITDDQYYTYKRVCDLVSELPDNYTCHDVAREVARSFPDSLESCRGYFAAHGIQHSWLRFRDDPEVIIDAYPVASGSGPFLVTTASSLNPWRRLYITQDAVMGKIEDMIGRLDPDDAAEIKAAQDVFRLVAINKRLRALNAKLLAAILAQQKIVDAQDAIIIAYKLQGRTPEKAIDAMRHHAETERMVRDAITEARNPATPKPGAKEPVHDNAMGR